MLKVATSIRSAGLTVRDCWTQAFAAAGTLLQSPSLHFDGIGLTDLDLDLTAFFFFLEDDLLASHVVHGNDLTPTTPAGT